MAGLTIHDKRVIEVAIKDFVKHLVDAVECGRIETSAEIVDFTLEYLDEVQNGKA